MNSILSKYSPEIIAKASKIKALVTDVDGVLTEGKITYDGNGLETKSFNVKDGLIVRHLREAGIKVGLITGRNSTIVQKRAEELKFDFICQGSRDKVEDYRDNISEYGLEDSEVAYIGDDINDLALMNLVGLSATPKDSPVYIQERVDLISSENGGDGVYREVADLILASQDALEKLL